MSLEQASHPNSGHSALLDQVVPVKGNTPPRVTFPLPFYPTDPRWHHGKYDQRQFRARRDVDKKSGKASRIHAGVDLEAPIGTPVLAIADGIVLRVGKFYSETFVIELLHPGVGIIRYGEVAKQPIWVIRQQLIRQGQKLAMVGQRFENGSLNPRAMLHLEYFADTTRTAAINPLQKNALTQGPEGTPGHPTFQRRGDLQDPTTMLESAPLYKNTLEMWPETFPEFTGSGHAIHLEASSMQPLDALALLIGAPVFRAENE